MSYEYSCTLFDHNTNMFVVITSSAAGLTIQEGPAEDELTLLETAEVDFSTEGAVMAYLADRRLIYVPSYSSEYSLNPVITTWMTRQQAHAHTAKVWNHELTAETQGARMDPDEQVEEPDLPASYDPAEFDDDTPTNVIIRSLIVEGTTYV